MVLITLSQYKEHNPSIEIPTHLKDNFLIDTTDSHIIDKNTKNVHSYAPVQHHQVQRLPEPLLLPKLPISMFQSAGSLWAGTSDTEPKHWYNFGTSSKLKGSRTLGHCNNDTMIHSCELNLYGQNINLLPNKLDKNLLNTYTDLNVYIKVFRSISTIS